MVGLRHISMAPQLAQFVDLWHRVQEVVLTDERDEIRWNLTTNGVYSAKSAYEVQFLARVPRPHMAR